MEGKFKLDKYVVLITLLIKDAWSYIVKSIDFFYSKIIIKHPLKVKFERHEESFVTHFVDFSHEFSLSYQCCRFCDHTLVKLHHAFI